MLSLNLTLAFIIKLSFLQNNYNFYKLGLVDNKYYLRIRTDVF